MLWMLLYLRKFLPGQARRLLEYRVLDREFADIVKQCSQFNRNLFRLLSDQAHCSIGKQSIVPDRSAGKAEGLLL